MEARRALRFKLRRASAELVRKGSGSGLSGQVSHVDGAAGDAGGLA